MFAQSPIPPAPSTLNPNPNINPSALDRGGAGVGVGVGGGYLSNSSHNTITSTNTQPAVGPAYSRPTSGSYFPSYQPQQQLQHPQPQRNVVDDQTLSNTLANTHIASPPVDNLNLANRQPKFTEEWDASVRGNSIIDGPSSAQNHPQQPNMQRSNSISSRSEVIPSDGASAHGVSLSRGNTLKKKNSLRRNGSIKRSGSRRSMKAGSVRSLALQSSHEPNELHSAFFCPVPTAGNPTEILANRFQTWRKVLKDLIAYFREIQNHYEHRSKSLLKLANVLNNTSTPPGFLMQGGLDDALQILRSHHKTAIVEANKAREIEEDVILALTGLRSDLNQKMKEIKSLAGDFKNTVDKEMDGTRKAVNALQEVLGQNEMDSALTTGKQDPYLLRLGVDRQIFKQLEEENYLHQAYLNIENSGRELESIVVGEIQKAYNAYAGILKRESHAAYATIEELQGGPISMPKDHEWNSFIQRDPQFVDPTIPMRSSEHIQYPGRDHYACQEIRAGLLERKSKYLKSYTAGWYVLSPTHLHEFKSADKTQAPVMSLYLPEQKLGSHSTEGGSSNKFILKGRQTGSMHRGHTWVFRAESHDTMMAWYEDIKALTEKSPEELSTFVRGHARTYSRSSQRSTSSDGMVDDEDDEPFSADPAVASPGSSRQESLQNRPEPGGRFPSDLQVNAQRGLQVPPLSPSSTGSGFMNSNDAALRDPLTQGNPSFNDVAAATMLPGSGVGQTYPGNRASQLVGHSYGNTPSMRMEEAPSHAAVIDQQALHDGVNPYNGEPGQPQRRSSGRWANAPEVVTGPVTENTPQTGGTSMTSLSLESSNAGLSNDAAVATRGQDYSLLMESGTQQQQLPMMSNNAGNGYPGKAIPATSQHGHSQMRPVKGERTNSIPHVPGEYPRSTPGGTPAAY